MSRTRFLSTVLSALLLPALALSAVAQAQTTPPQQMTPAQRLADQKKMLAPLSWMDGTWRGKAVITLPDGKTHTITQTERIGSTQGGVLKVLQGRGYEADGTASFDALAILSYDSEEKTYSLTSFSSGYGGKFKFKPTADGYIWEIPQGPKMTLRYTAVLKGGTWTETGENIEEGKLPVRTFQMVLKRLGDTNWMNDNLVPYK